MFPLAKKTNKHVEIKMYGDIGVWGEVNANRIKNLLHDIKKEGYEKVTFLVHSPGGSVFEGIAIKNTIAGSGLEIEFVIEGIAASMMTQVMLAGYTKAYADAKIMVHEAKSAPFGGAKRLRQEAELLDKINSDMADNYAQKTGKPKDWILKNWLKEDADVWLTAKEAKEAGLIDEVLEKSKLKKATAETDYKAIVAHYNTELLNNDTDMKDKLQPLLALFGETLAQEASEQDLFASLHANLKSVLQENKELKAQKQAEALESIKAQMLEKGIPAKLQEIYLELAKTNLEVVKNLVGAMPSQKTQVQNSEKKSQEAEDRSEWTYADWEKKDPEGLLALLKRDPSRFEALAATY